MENELEYEEMSDFMQRSWMQDVETVFRQAILLKFHKRGLKDIVVVVTKIGDDDFNVAVQWDLDTGVTTEEVNDFVADIKRGNYDI